MLTASDEEETPLLTPQLQEDYKVVIMALHKVAHELKIPKRNIALLVPAVIVSLVSIHPYIGPAIELADNPYEEVMNLIGSLALNFFLGLYFLTLALIGQASLGDKDAKLAYERLCDLNLSLTSKVFNFFKKWILLPVGAIASGYPFYAADREEDSSMPDSIPSGLRDFLEHIPLVHEMVWAAFAGMQYVGIRDISDKQWKYIEKGLVVPWLIKQGYYHAEPKAYFDHELLKKFQKLHQAHINRERAAHKHSLSIMQAGDPAKKLDELYGILNSIDYSEANAAQLKNNILALIPKQQESKLEKFGVYSSQFLLSLLTTISLIGYYLSTADTSKSLLGKHASRVWLYIVGTFLFAPFYDIGIFLISFEVGAALFSLLYNAGVGVKETWQGSDGVVDFFSKSENITKMSSWETVVKFPLNYQLNPKALVTTMLLAHFISYYSAPMSLSLNEDELGKSIADNGLIKIPTIVGTIIFNAFPVDQVIGTVLRTYHKLWGSDVSKQKIRLDEFITMLIERDETIPPEKFFEFLYEMSQAEDGEQKLAAYLGDDLKPGDIIAANESSTELSTMTEVLEQLKLAKDRIGLMDKTSLRAMRKNRGLFKGDLNGGTSRNLHVNEEVSDGLKRRWCC